MKLSTNKPLTIPNLFQHPFSSIFSLLNHLHSLSDAVFVAGESDYLTFLFLFFFVFLFFFFVLQSFSRVSLFFFYLFVYLFSFSYFFSRVSGGSHNISRYSQVLCSIYFRALRSNLYHVNAVLNPTPTPTSLFVSFSSLFSYVLQCQQTINSTHPLRHIHNPLEIYNTFFHALT